MIKYKIQKHKQLGKYVLWKENKYSCRGIYQGTKQECEDKLKEIRGKENE